MNTSANRSESVLDFDAVVVGAGFAGMYLIHHLRQKGLSVRAYETASDVGGTWYWNRYPGARVDVVSMEYSFQFSAELQQEWNWGEKYSPQPELLNYANHVADRFNLRKDIRFETRVTAATFDEDTGLWTIVTDRGETVRSQLFILATGILSVPNMPPFEGLDLFGGETYHTGKWPKDPVDFAGKRVAVVGTGSSGVQVIPEIAREAAHVTVLQRTPNYVIPARNRPLDQAEAAKIKAHYPEFRKKMKQMPFGFDFVSTGKSALEVNDEEREREYEAAWERGGLMFIGIFDDLLLNEDANKTAQDFFRRKIKSIVNDSDTAKKLTPDFNIGCKRLSVGTNYYETYNRENVSLVSLQDEPIERFTPTGVVVGGRELKVDAVVFATGFDAVSGPILNIDILGRGGRSIRDKWAKGPHCYLGLMTEGFPNLFTVTGPGSPSLLSNLIGSIETHVEFIGSCVTHMKEHGKAIVEPSREAEDLWLKTVDDIASRSIFFSCNSWYLGSNIPGKPRVFTAYLGVPAYNELLADVVRDSYRGFTFSNAPVISQAETSGAAAGG